MKRSFCLALFLLSTLASNPANAAYNLKWNPSPGIVHGYQVHYGADQGVHPYSVDVGNVTEYPLDLLPLDRGADYYFVVTAYNQVGESAPSNEVHWRTEEEPAVQPDDGAVAGGNPEPPSEVVDEGDGEAGGTGGGEEAYLPVEIVIDNGEEATSSSGIWRPSSGSDAFGGSSLYNHLSGSYIYEMRLNGLFEVALWWSSYPNRCGSVPVSIYDGGDLLEKVLIDQRTGGGLWNPIGTYAFSGTGKVVLQSQGWCTTCADAVRFLEQEGGNSDLPPETVEGDGDDGTPASDEGDAGESRDDGAAAPHRLPWKSWRATTRHR